MPIALDLRALLCKQKQYTSYTCSKPLAGILDTPRRPNTMARLIVALAMMGGAAAQLTIDAVNPKVVEAEYAVRGKILDRAGEIERDMAENPDKWPFKEIVRCNIGNPRL